MSVRIINGDCREALKALPDASVHCCVTSPPYWGLRDYGVAGQLGLEPDYRDHILALVEVFREVRRVLRPDGTLWLNYGDCYASSVNGRSAADTKAVGNDDRTFRDKPFSTVQGVLKPKDLVMMPARVAIALQEDGWWLRSEIVWVKPNPMPESITDRPSSAHEKVYLLARSPKYFYDAEAVREPMVAASMARLSQNVEAQEGSWRANGGAKTNGPMKAVAKGNARTFRGDGVYTGSQSFENGALIERQSHGNEPNETGSRNARNVWTIATQPFSEAHFATFPPELAERCIKAGTSEKGCCAACGAPWKRVIDTPKPPREVYTRRNAPTDELTYSGSRVGGVMMGHGQKLQEWRDANPARTIGWQRTCECNVAAVPCTILDPFAGAFTSLMVADRLQRNGIGIELNPDYCEMARKRLTRDAGLFAEVAAE